MNLIDALPELDWTEQAAKEIACSPNLVESSDFAYQVEDLFIAGWHYPVFSLPPWFWFALTKNFVGVKLRKLRELQALIPPNAHTAVEQDWRVGERFAKYFGFQPVEQTLTAAGTLYQVYRRP